MLKIGVVVPDRNDRPELLAHCLWMMGRQTVKPDHIIVVNQESGIQGHDLTWRYKKGIDEAFRVHGCDVVPLIENDDFYAHDYIERMTTAWKLCSKPDVFGLSHTQYYHVGLRKYRNMNHNNRSSAFTTLIGHPEVLGHIADIPDTETFFDLHLWKNKDLRREVIQPNGIIALGIKHGIGMCGGKGHLTSFPYENADPDYKHLRSIVDEQSFKLYEKIGQEQI